METKKVKKETKKVSKKAVDKNSIAAENVATEPVKVEKTEKVEKVEKAEKVETCECGTFSKKVGPVPVIALVAVAAVVFIALIGIIACVCLNSGKKVEKYPVVFVSDDKLYVGTKNGKYNRVDNDFEKYKTDIIYKNEGTDKFLYLSDDTLYEVKSKNGEKKKIASDVKQAIYSDNDKYIIYLDEDNNLYSYKKSSKKIAKNVSRLYAAVNNKVYYSKGDSLYFVGTLAVKDPVKIDSDVSGFSITEDKKYGVYLKSEDGLTDVYRIKIGSKKGKKVVTGAKNIIAYNDDYSEFIYTTESSKNTYNLDGILKDDLKADDENYMDRYNGSGYDSMSYSERYDKYYVEQRDKIREYVKDEGIDVKSYDVYYAKNNKSKKLASGVNNVLAADVDTKTVVYVKQTLDKNKKLLISDYKYLYDFKDDVEELLSNSLYISKNGKKEVSIVKNASDVNAYIAKGNVFYVTKKDGKYDLNMAKISFGKAKTKEVASDIDSKYLVEFKDGFLYGTNESSKNSSMDLNFVKPNGKSKVIATDIYSGRSPIISNNEKKVFFYQNYDNGEGDYVVYNGSRVKTIMENVSRVYYLTDDYMYVLNDCDSKGECDLSIYKGSKKLRKIASDVSEVVSYRN